MARLILSISILLFVFACGGGGSSSSAASGSSGSPGSSGSGGAAQGYQVQEKIQAVD
tara:strand:- start:116 stop:286 length:171 start_codon:yes stop_codon:yes gene_type:complete